MDAQVDPRSDGRRRSSRELAEALVRDHVVGAGWFAPNARGRWEFSSRAGIADRRRLRSRGSDIGGRRLFALTDATLHVLVPWRGVFGRAEVARWHRHEMLARPVPSRLEAGVLAVEIVDRPHRWPVAEVRPLDDGALEVMSQLLRLPAASTPNDLPREAHR